MAVTIDDVKKVLPSPPANLSDDQYTLALETAQLIVSEQLVGVADCNMSQDRLDKITVYLAAHFAEPMSNSADGMPSGGLKRSKLGEADESYFGPANDDGTLGYRSTRWGQLAIALDTCGILAGSTANAGLMAQLRVV